MDNLADEAPLVVCDGTAGCYQSAEIHAVSVLVLCRQVFSFVHAQFTFFHQGFDLLRDLEPTMKTMAAQVQTPLSTSSE